MLHIQNLHKSFRHGFRHNKIKEVLHGIDIDIQDNDIHALLGQNGAGKTTLIQCIMGFLEADDGKIIVDKKKFSKHSIKKIGYAPDNTHYYHHLTGLEHLIQVGQLGGESKTTCEKKGRKLLQKVGLEATEQIYVKDYSAGMKKRLGIAISLINDPKFLIRDEPMNGLDPLGRILVKGLMKELQSQGKTILFSTHILSDVEEIADAFSILHTGKIIYSTTTKKTRKGLETIFREKVTEANEKEKI